MESIHTKIALDGSTNECARTQTVFLFISEVSDGAVSQKGVLFIIFSKALDFLSSLSIEVWGIIQ